MFPVAKVFHAEKPKAHGETPAHLHKSTGPAELDLHLTSMGPAAFWRIYYLRVPACDRAAHCVKPCE